MTKEGEENLENFDNLSKTDVILKFSLTYSHIRILGLSYHNCSMDLISLRASGRLTEWWVQKQEFIQQYFVKWIEQFSIITEMEI